MAYDTYLAATQAICPACGAGPIRCQVMLLISFQFWRSNCRHMADFFRQDGINTLRTWLRVLKFLLVKPGMHAQDFPALSQLLSPRLPSLAA